MITIWGYRYPPQNAFWKTGFNVSCSEIPLNTLVPPPTAHTRWSHVIFTPTTPLPAASPASYSLAHAHTNASSFHVVRIKLSGFLYYSVKTRSLVALLIFTTKHVNTLCSRGAVYGPIRNKSFRNLKSRCRVTVALTMTSHHTHEGYLETFNMNVLA